MSGNYQVTVLGPCGRRTNIKVTPGTSILQVIEEACTKQKLDPNLYDAKHLRRVLDSSSTIRYSNVPNKALLELVECSVPRKDGSVTVNLVTESGLRLIADFHSNCSLLEIIKHHANEGSIEIPEENSDQESVIVYTMRRITSKELEKTTLKSLGLLSGKCMIRYNVQKLSPNGPTQANVSSPLVKPPKPVIVEKETITAPMESELPQGSNSITETGVEMYDSRLDNSSNVSDHQNIESKPPFTNNSTKLGVGQSLRESELLTSKEVKSDACEEEEGNKMEIDEMQNEKSSSPIEDSIASSSCDIKEPSVVQLGSNGAILFHWDDASSVRYETEPDDFFDLTVNEVKKLYKEKVQALKEFDDVPLMTTQMRQLEKDSRLLSAMNRHPVTNLRICFPDRHVIQANFKPRNTIREVMNFVRPFLSQCDLEFSLFTIMPKTTLDPNVSLVEADCIPNARLYFESKVQLDSYLSETTLSKKSSFEGAEKCVNKSKLLKQKREPEESQPSTSKASNPVPKPRSSAASETTNKPKWFKLGK